MDRELIDRAWRVLPAEFREKVKDNYRELTQALGYFQSKTSLNNEECDRCDLIREKIAIYNILFGHHNLTSDAEGEDELLIVPRSKVQGKWQRAYENESEYAKAEQNPTIYAELYYNRGILSILDTLFGSKCLPDGNEDNFATKEPKNCDNPLADKEGCKWLNNGKCAFDSACYFGPLNPQEPKPAEPKFKRGDMVRVVKIGDVFRGDIGEIIDVGNNGACYVLFPHTQAWFRFADLEPYAEPKDEHNSDNTDQKSANVSSMFDTIIKDSFREHNRLHVASILCGALLANPNTDKSFSKFTDYGGRCEKEDYIANKALRYADALIGKCKEGGES